MFCFLRHKKYFTATGYQYVLLSTSLICARRRSAITRDDATTRRAARAAPGSRARDLLLSADAPFARNCDSEVCRFHARRNFLILDFKDTNELLA